MEFNIEADCAGARLRTGVGTHTLCVGDHDATVMINGSRVELMRLALAIADQTGLKITIDGRIDGNAAYQEIVAALNGDEDLLKFSLGNALKQLNTQRVQIEQLHTRLASTENSEPMPKVRES